MTGPHLPGFLGCWVSVYGSNLGILEMEIRFAKSRLGHAPSVPDREERHLLSEDLGSGEPVSRASARKERIYKNGNFLERRV